VLTVLRVRANLGGHRLRAAPAALILSGAAHRSDGVARRRVWGRTSLRPHPRHRPEAVAAQALPRLRCALPKLRIGAGAMSTPLHRLGCGPVRNGRAADLWSVGRGHDDNRRDSASLTRIAAADQRRVARDFGGTRARPELPVGPLRMVASCAGLRPRMVRSASRRAAHATRQGTATCSGHRAKPGPKASGLRSRRCRP
jgi:hypothetical protein